MRESKVRRESKDAQNSPLELEFKKADPVLMQTDSVVTLVN